MTYAVLLAITAHLLWATGNILNVKLSRKLTPLQTIFWQTIFGAVIITPMAILKPVNIPLNAVLITGLLSLTLYGGSLLFYTALQKGSAQIGGAITATVPAFIAVLSVIFLDTRLKPIVALIIFIITLGLMVISWPKKKSKIDLSIGLALGAVALWAVYFTFITKSIELVGPIWANYITSLCGIIILFLYGKFTSSKELARPTGNMLRLIILSAICVGGAPLAYNFAIERANPALIAPIASSYAALFIIASSIIYKDRVSKRHWLGVTVTIVSVLAFIIVS